MRIFIWFPAMNKRRPRIYAAGKQSRMPRRQVHPMAVQRSEQGAIAWRSR